MASELLNPDNPVEHSVIKAKNKLNSTENPDLQGMYWRQYICNQSGMRNNSARTTTVDGRETYQTNLMRNAELEREGVVSSQRESRTKWGQGKTHVQMNAVNASIKWKLADPNKSILMKTEIEVFLSKIPYDLHKSMPVVISENDGQLECHIDLMGVGLAKKEYVTGIANILEGLVSEPGSQIKKLDYVQADANTSSLSKEANGLRPFTEKIRLINQDPIFTNTERIALEKMKSDKSAVVVIHGKTGQGKTTFAREAIIQMQKATFSNRTNGIYQSTFTSNYVNVFDEKLDEMIVVTPSEGERDATTILKNFKSFAEKHKGKQVVLVVDNMHDGIDFPNPTTDLNRELLETLDDLRTQFSSRKDGSSVFLMGESLPAGLDASILEAHRASLVLELRLESDDVVLTEKNQNPLALKVMTGAVFNDGFKVLQAELDQSRGVEAAAFYKNYQMICNEVIASVLASKKVIEFMKRPESAYLSRSKLKALADTIASTVQAQTREVLLKNVKDQYLVTTDGQNVSWNHANSDSAYNMVIDRLTDELINSSTITYDDKEIALGDNRLINVNNDESSLRSKSSAESIVAGVNREEAEIQNRLKELEDEKSALNARAAELESFRIKIGDTPLEQLDFILKNASAIKMVGKILSGKVGEISKQEFEMAQLGINNLSQDNLTDLSQHRALIQALSLMRTWDDWVRSSVVIEALTKQKSRTETLNSILSKIDALTEINP